MKTYEAPTCYTSTTKVGTLSKAVACLSVSYPKSETAFQSYGHHRTLIGNTLLKVKPTSQCDCMDTKWPKLVTKIL